MESITEPYFFFIRRLDRSNITLFMLLALTSHHPLSLTEYTEQPAEASTHSFVRGPAYYGLQRRTEPRPQVMYKNIVKYGYVVFEIYGQTYIRHTSDITGNNNNNNNPICKAPECQKTSVVTDCNALLQLKYDKSLGRNKN